ncbi:hypothetical protein KTR10_00075 [Candidatus Kaiserbacteria bacterium]|nr:hypothetical protein [Candidatus Kaiserbacteria bacterium]
MTTVTQKAYWEQYREKECAYFTPLLKKLGYTLDTEQPHIYGERYLMHAVTTESGTKLILLGKNTRGTRVVIKVTRDKGGMREILHERLCRSVLEELQFAYGTFASPKECFFKKTSEYVIFIQEYIEQPSMFIERPLEEQFTLALTAFKAQEGARATTFSHLRLIKKTFEARNADDYLTSFNGFRRDILKTFPEYTSLLQQVAEVLSSHKTTIERYGQFLTHTDLVPHNFRVKDGTVYLLDHSSLRFGNKYEGWARFINFMTLYNPELAQLLTQYVKDNRTEEESTALWLMRLYRLTELMLYYTNTLPKSSGDLKELNTARVHFWAEVLAHTLEKEELPEDVRTTYMTKRDVLRSTDEKKRQIGLH